MTNQPKILLVDDDPSLLSLLAIRLKAAGYDVIQVESGEKALAHLPTIRPNLVITDLRMDGMDGMALFDLIHQQHPALPVIILTAHGTIPAAVDATQRGVFSFLTKPFDSRNLLQWVEQGLRISPGSHAKVTEESADNQWRRDILTRCPEMETLLSHAFLAARSEASILINGESGTGKELVARAIHNASPRSEGPFVAVNTTAIPESLLESELFGHIKGAFTSANRDHKGLFQAADGGTLFLDEIGDMPLGLQAKLLRALQEREVRPVGTPRSVPIDIRVISATHRDLVEAMANGQFREDLYYRVNVINLKVPSLAERRGDIPLLATHFLNKIQASPPRVTGLSPEAMNELVNASWPGNVRQLHNVVEQLAALTTAPIVPASMVKFALQSNTGKFPPLSEARHSFERDYLVQLLQSTEGNVSHAARLARRERSKFYQLLRRHHLDPEMFRPENS